MRATFRFPGADIVHAAGFRHPAIRRIVWTPKVGPAAKVGAMNKHIYIHVYIYT